MLVSSLQVMAPLRIKRTTLSSTPCLQRSDVELWFSILQRKRLKIADLTSIDDLRIKLYQHIEPWNQNAHPFKWTAKSVAKIMAYAEPLRVAA